MDDENRDALETIAYVARSPSRVCILERFGEEESVPKERLQASVDVVRTTFQRNLQGLRERGLVRKGAQPGTYERTPSGSLVATAIDDALSTVDTAIRLQPVFEHVPRSAIDVDLERLADATLVRATTANPYAPVERHEERIAETDHARVVLPATGADPLEKSREMVSEGAVHEVIVTPAVATALRSDPSLSETFEAMGGQETSSVFVIEEEIPFYLGILDSVVQIGVQDESGLPTAILESTDPQVREWAIDRFESYEARSEHVV